MAANASCGSLTCSEKQADAQSLSSDGLQAHPSTVRSKADESLRSTGQNELQNVLTQPLSPASGKKSSSHWVAEFHPSAILKIWHHQHPVATDLLLLMTKMILHPQTKIVKIFLSTKYIPKIIIFHACRSNGLSYEENLLKSIPETGRYSRKNRDKKKHRLHKKHGAI